jgi:broad specificity polyphosphatase/5'/3'-nucleotidase SurE
MTKRGFISALVMVFVFLRSTAAAPSQGRSAASHEIVTDGPIIKGFRIVPQNTRVSGEAFEGRTNPRGTRYFCPLYQPIDSGDVQTDVWAVRNGYVSISPFRIDQTDPSVLERLGTLESIPWKR